MMLAIASFACIAITACSGQGGAPSGTGSGNAAGSDFGNSSAESSTNSQQSQQSQQPAAQSPDQPDPMTIHIYNASTSTTEEMFMDMYGTAIINKFPYVSFNYTIPTDTNPEAQLTGMISAKETIDIMFVSDALHYRLVKPFGLGSDMSDLVKSHNFDLSSIEPKAIEAIQAVSDGQLQALPISMTNQVLLYNKDLFEKFGKDEPRDGITWDEVYTLAQEMTRTESDVQYRGFVTQFYNIGWQNQLSVGFVDPKTDQSLFTTDERWFTIVRNITRFFDIPNNGLTESTRYWTPIHNMFYVDKVAAMYAYSLPGSETDLNWDMVGFPEFKERPGVGPQPVLNLAYVSSLSKNRDVAFDIIGYLTSPEIQEAQARKAIMPVSLNEQAIASFGSEVPHLQGRNLRAIFYKNLASPFPASEYNRTAALVFEEMMYALSQGLKDVNTALRDAAETVNMQIKELKDQK